VQITLCTVGIPARRVDGGDRRPANSASWALVAGRRARARLAGGMRSLVGVGARTPRIRVAAGRHADRDPAARVVHSQVRFTYSPPSRLSWKQTHGDIKSVSGEWELEDLGAARTRATYRLTACRPRPRRHAAPRPAPRHAAAPARRRPRKRAESRQSSKQHLTGDAAADPFVRSAADRGTGRGSGATPATWDRLPHGLATDGRPHDWRPCAGPLTRCSSRRQPAAGTLIPILHFLGGSTIDVPTSDRAIAQDED